MKPAILIFLLLCGSAVHAAQQRYEFSYTFSSGTALWGAFTGELQSDGDTILINTMEEAYYPTARGDYSLSTELDGLNTVNYASLSGVFMDMHYATLSPSPHSCAPNSPYANDWGMGSTGSSLGNIAGVYIEPSPSVDFFDCFWMGGWPPLQAEAYNPAGWSVVVSEVPLPAAAWLFLTALGGLGLARKMGNS